MAPRTVLGTETEFGITVVGDRSFNPVAASSAVVDGYAGAATRVRWSFDEESPGRDLREEPFGTSPRGDPGGGFVNTVLTNGARLYVDHAHPEYAAPECADPLSAALYDKAGERVMAAAAAAASEAMGDGRRIVIHKNNSDGKGNSYGAHENYLISRDTPFADVAAHLIPFFATRQIFTGSGKVGVENGRPHAPYQITQRADFFEEEVGLETTIKRPIVNTRDEPHADPSRYRRLHVIIGDANLSEVQTFLKLGATALVLDAVEHGALGDPPRLEDPVREVWSVSHDPRLDHRLRLDGGSDRTALQMQWDTFEAVSRHVERHGLPPAWEQVLAAWESILSDLERGPEFTADRLDWTAKLRLLDAYRDRDGLAWDDAKLRLLALQYHDVDAKRSLYARLVRRGDMRRLFDDGAVAAATQDPPQDTRAYFRGECVRRYPDAVVAANWDSLVFDVGEETLRRVPMMEPRRGTKEHVGALLEASEDATTMIEMLGGNDG